MDRNQLDSRLRELSIYSEFYHRKELKALAQILVPGEQVNCILTGVHEANRKMLVVTDRRIIIIFAGTLGAGDVKIIQRESVGSWRFEKKLLFSSVRIDTKGGASFTFTNTQGHLEQLFNWAMEQPLSGEA